jgi:hypothetical protein
LITVALSATISAPTERVWQALTDPDERITWDDRILGRVGLIGLARSGGGAGRAGREIDRGAHRTHGIGNAGDRAAEGRVKTADRARPLVRSASPNRANERSQSSVTQWRFRLGGVPLVMRDEILSDEPIERRVSRITIGSMHFDQTLTLRREDDDNGPRTRLSMKLVARNRIAVIGDIVDRLDVQKIIIEYVDTTLRQVQKHCEADA